MTAQSTCATGEYSYAGEINCRECPGGYGCTTSLPSPCNSGQYSAYGSSTCTT